MTGFIPFAEDAVDLFGVAIRAHSQRVEQRHVGVVYRDIEQRVRFLHFAAHDELVCSLCNESYHWAEVELDRYNKMMLSELAALIAEKRSGRPLPYGFEYQGGAPAPIGRDGEWDTVMSMTCSTFVLSLFVVHGYPLVDIATWPQRYSDLEWARTTLTNYLVNVYESPLDFDRIQAIIPSYVRVRPEESAVAAKGVSSPMPYTFADVEQPSLALVDQLVAHASQGNVDD